MDERKKKKQRALNAGIGVGAAVVTALVIVLAIVVGVSQPETRLQPSSFGVIEAGAEAPAESH